MAERLLYEELTVQRSRELRVESRDLIQRSRDLREAIREALLKLHALKERLNLRK
jgi:hypothetical protein